MISGNLLGMLAAKQDNVIYDNGLIGKWTGENDQAITDFIRLPLTAVFDTGPGTYPSISGTHNGTITPNQTIPVQNLYTYFWSESGGHTEFVRIWGNGIDMNATWDGYVGDWHNISFPKSLTLDAGKTYNYTIRTGSYPQIIHKASLNATGGTITCTEFVDVNGITYTDWIPAIRLEALFNLLPTAYIDSISPSPATQGATVTFTGHGTDPDGTVVAYNWRSSIDGQLSSSASFSTSILSVGTHTIYFKVEDNNGSWSSEVSTTLVINTVGGNLPTAVTLYNPVMNMTETGIDKITLSWSQNTETNFDRYEVHMSAVPGFTPDATTVVANITSSAVPNTTAASYTSWGITMGVQPDTTYYFKIRVYNKNGLWNDSNEMDTTEPQISYIKEKWDSTFEGVSPEGIYYNNQYYLFYCSLQGMVYQTSLDGMSNWSSATSLGIGGGDPNVIICENGSLRLLYKGSEPVLGTNVLKSAFSTDGTVWTEEGSNLVSGVDVPTLVQVSGKQYRVYYCNSLITPFDGIYSAVSNDEGRTWTEEGLCFSDNGRDPAPVDPEVIKLPDGNYTMYYIANIGLLNTSKGDEKIQIHSQIYSAISSDGRNFIPAGLVIDYGGIDNSFCLIDPSAIILPSDDFRVYYGYQAKGENTFYIGSAMTMPKGPGPSGVPPLFSSDVNANLTALFDEYNNSIPKNVLITWLNDTGNEMLAGAVGPTQHKLYAAYSLDGIHINGTVDENGYTCEYRTFLLPNASVPDAVMSPDNTTVRLYFVDAHPTRKIINALSLISGENITTDDLWFLYNEYYIGGTNIFNTASSGDGENFTFDCMRIVGLSEDYMVADPSTVLLENGSYRIYFLYVAKSELPEGEGDPAAAKNHSIGCAYSPDGVNFTFEGICYSGVYGECLSDPEVSKTGEYYRLYLHPTGTVSSGNLPFRYINSTDGGRTFTGAVVWIQIEHMWDVAGCGCRIVHIENGYRIYFGYNSSTASAFSSDGINWVFDEMPKVGGRGYMAAVKFKGMYFLYFHA